MIKNIVKGEQIFSKKATPATEADRQVITDLLDTRFKLSIDEGLIIPTFFF